MIILLASYIDYKMIDLKALLALLVVGQLLGLSTAGKRRSPWDKAPPITNYTQFGDAWILEFLIPQLLTDTKVEDDVKTFKNLLIHHRDAPVPAGKLPINNRKSHEVGQYVLIMRNLVAKLLAVSEKHIRLITIEKALNETLGESMSKYGDDYKGKLQPMINTINHVQDVLEPIFKMIADLSQETDPSQQLKIYLKYELDNKPNAVKLRGMLSSVARFLELVNKYPVSEQNILVEQGAESYVLLNTWETKNIVYKALDVAWADPTRQIYSSRDEIFV